MQSEGSRVDLQGLHINQDPVKKKIRKHGKFILKLRQQELIVRVHHPTPHLRQPTKPTS
jgi:hypothetical protein